MKSTELKFQRDNKIVSEEKHDYSKQTATNYERLSCNVILRDIPR